MVGRGRWLVTALEEPLSPHPLGVVGGCVHEEVQKVSRCVIKAMPQRAPHANMQEDKPCSHGRASSHRSLCPLSPPRPVYHSSEDQQSMLCESGSASTPFRTRMRVWEEKAAHNSRFWTLEIQVIISLANPSIPWCR